MQSGTRGNSLHIVQMMKLLPLLWLGLILSILALAGCRRSEKPEAVWDGSDGRIRPLVYPRGIAYAPAADQYFVVDRLAQIQRISGDGRFLNQWQMPAQQNGRPVNISVGPDGNIYIPDTHYHRVVVYTPDGKLLRQWGSFGTGPGQFTYLTDVAFDRQGRIFVSEYGDNDRVQVFDANARLLYQFGRFGQGDGEFSRPQSMVIDNDLVYITDACNHRIVVFTTQGQFVRAMGKAGSGPGEFRFPYGLDQARDGNLVVTEFGNNRVQKIDKTTGKSIWIWGHTGRETGELAYPWAAVVNNNGQVVIADSGNNRLQILHR